MGGRGGAGGGIGAVRSAVEHSEFWESAKSNAYLGAEKLLKSPTFVESVKEAIGKEAFMRNYDITQKQTDTLTNKMIRALAEGKAPKNNNREKESAEDYAKRYFREHYNPNREQREITSSTYKRAQNNLQNSVNSFFGRGMEKKKKKK
jgi:hypothetical protein